MIRNNINIVKNKIEASCQKAGRNINDVHLVAVSKTKPVSMLQEAYDAGIRDFGENKVQEILEKYDKLPSDIRWHMIGHLQRNKVKYIIDKVCLIHSVDSLRLAEEINKEAAKHNLIMPILIELNIAEEDSKFGLSFEECEEMILKLAADKKLTKFLSNGARTSAEQHSSKYFAEKVLDVYKMAIKNKKPSYKEKISNIRTQK